MYFLISLMKLVPKNLLSFLLGAITRLELPTSMQNFLNRNFVNLFKINIEEAEKSLDSYRTIEEVFTRKLKENSRTIESDIVCPADGSLCISMPTRKERAIQAKGLQYSLEELAFGVQGCGDRNFDPRWYTTVYLAPHNYHRVHSSLSGTLKSIRYIPGELWPVNMPFVKSLPNLFVKNERMIFEIEHESGGIAYIVMVGALNVGRMETHFMPQLTTNSFDRQFGTSPVHMEYGEGKPIKAGDELGVFMLGSTAICIFDDKLVKEFSFQQLEFSTRSVSMGHSLLTK